MVTNTLPIEGSNYPSAEVGYTDFRYSSNDDVFENLAIFPTPDCFSRPSGGTFPAPAGYELESAVRAALSTDMTLEKSKIRYLLKSSGLGRKIPAQTIEALVDYIELLKRISNSGTIGGDEQSALNRQTGRVFNTFLTGSLLPRKTWRDLSHLLYGHANYVTGMTDGRNNSSIIHSSVERTGREWCEKNDTLIFRVGENCINFSDLTILVSFIVQQTARDRCQEAAETMMRKKDEIEEINKMILEEIARQMNKGWFGRIIGIVVATVTLALTIATCGAALPLFVASIMWLVALAALTGLDKYLIEAISWLLQRFGVDEETADKIAPWIYVAIIIVVSLIGFRPNVGSIVNAINNFIRAPLHTLNTLKAALYAQTISTFNTAKNAVQFTEKVAHSTERAVRQSNVILRGANPALSAIETGVSLYEGVVDINNAIVQGNILGYEARLLQAEEDEEAALKKMEAVYENLLPRWYETVSKIVESYNKSNRNTAENFQL